MSGTYNPGGEGDPIESKAQLIAHSASGEKPRERWRIGTEHEKFGFNLKTRQPLAYESDGASVRKMLDGLTRFGWQPIVEDGKTVALKRQDGSITLEPGGQFELSGAPLETLHETCREVNGHLREVREVADEIGAGFLGLGFTPVSALADIPMMPKARYQIMRDYMPKVGGLGHQMMFRSCTVQTNLDFSSEADMVKKMRVSLALQPVATALFANSPFADGRPNGYLSYRAHVWTDVDPNRTGMLPFAFEEGFGYEQYVDWALDAPMYFVKREGRYIDASGQSFRDFLQGKLPALPGVIPVLSDWEDHLSTLFPEVRLKTFLEQRGADGGPWSNLCALPAFWVGLLYDDAALDAAWEYVKDWTREERACLRIGAARFALKTPFRTRTLQDVAKDVLAIARSGLKARARLNAHGEHEALFLDDLDAIARTGLSPAERLLERYHGAWGGKLDAIFEEAAY